MFRLIIDQLSACRWLLPVGRHGSRRRHWRSSGSCGDGDTPFITLSLRMWKGCSDTRRRCRHGRAPRGGRSRGPWPPPTRPRPSWDRSGAAAVTCASSQEQTKSHNQVHSYFTLMSPSVQQAEQSHRERVRRELTARPASEGPSSEPRAARSRCPCPCPSGRLPPSGPCVSAQWAQPWPRPRGVTTWCLVLSLATRW